MRPIRNPAAFTLVELLVVVAIIGVLTALLLPAVQAARESARRTTCANNMRQLGVAAQLFHDVEKHFPGTWVNGDKAISCGLSMLPYIEQPAIAGQWDRSVRWWEGRNSKLIAIPVPVYRCPSSPAPATYEFFYEGDLGTFASGDYKACQGANGSDPVVAHWNRSGWLWGVTSRAYVSASQITDGLSATALMVEGIGGKEIYGPGGQLDTPAEIWDPTDGAWVGRAFSSVSPANYAETKKLSQCTINCSSRYDYGPYSFHPNVALCVLCDGAVRVLGENIDSVVLSGLYPYNEGESSRSD